MLSDLDGSKVRSMEYRLFQKGGTKKQERVESRMCGAV